MKNLRVHVDIIFNVVFKRRVAHVRKQGVPCVIFFCNFLIGSRYDGCQNNINSLVISDDASNLCSLLMQQCSNAAMQSKRDAGCEQSGEGMDRSTLIAI